MAFHPRTRHFPVHDGPTASLHGGTRSAGAIRYAVIHATEGNTAKGVAEDFSTRKPPDYGSAQLVIDDHSCYRCLPDTTTPYAAPPLNTNGVHVEQCGFSAWSRKEWLTHRPTIEETAYHVAKWCHRYNIPVKWRTRIGLALGRQGITSHNAISHAFHLTDHTDPGRGYPRRYFMRCVRFYFARL